LRIPLQEIGHADSQYERPNQRWVCGWAKDGNPCKLGPDGKGRCTVAAQSICQPVKDGDRWVCIRSEVLGGACTAGPSPTGECACPPTEQHPCQPVRSLRAKRTRLTISAGLFAAAVLLVWLMSPNSLTLVSPGALSAAHLAIEGPPGLPNCQICHQGAEAGFGSWLSMIANQTETHSVEVNQQCLGCHFSETDESIAMNVHSTAELSEASPAVEQLSMLAGSTSFMLSLSDKVHSKPMPEQTQATCSTCHNEHEGATHDMKVMSDTQCQVCHTNQFESFNDGHPAFTQASSISTGIIFDHAKHQPRFDDGLNCQSCHRADAEGKTMAVRPFENSCQGCHEQGSQDHHGDAIKKNPVPFLQLPEMEFEDSIYWPTELAVGENLTPMMTLLLAGDDEALPLLAEIHDEDGAAGDMYEWFFILEDEDELEKKAELAAAIKRLVSELADYSATGEKDRIVRLTNAFSVDPTEPELQALLAELSAANFVMQMFKQRYLPQLEDDLAGDEVDASDDEELPVNWMASKHTSGWRVDSDEGAISYRAVAHSDSWLKTWIEMLGKSQGRADEATTLDELRSDIREKMLDELNGDFKSCTKCHSGQSEAAPWSATERLYDASGFTKFNHRPHMAMLNEAGNCLTCHVPKNESSDTSIAMPRGFQPHDKETCSSCHAPGKANNTCLNCHQYHHERP